MKAKIVIGTVVFVGIVVCLILVHQLSGIGTEVFAATLGIVGVALTLYVNALLSQHQQHRQWENDNDRRKAEQLHQRTALRIVLLEELKDLHSSLTEGLKTLEGVEESDSTLVPKEVNDSVYRSVVSHLGILTESEVGEIVRTYRMISRQNEKLGLIGKTNESMRVIGTTEVAPENYLVIPYDTTHVLIKIYMDIISNLETSISMLTKNMEN